MAHQSEPELTISKSDGAASSMEISTAENAQETKTLEEECAKVKPSSAQLSANESKCPQCGRLFKNASALHNHTRRGTKCKSGEEQNPSKQNWSKGFETNLQKVKQSGNQQSNLPKWSKNSASGNYEGVQSLKGGDQIGGGGRDSKVGVNFSQKQRESGELKCLDCPGMIFKNDMSLKVHLRGHKTRERWGENVKLATTSLLPGSSFTQLSVRTSPKTPALAFPPEPSIISTLQLPFTTDVTPRMQSSVSRETSTVEAKTVIPNPKPSSLVQSEKNTFSAPPSFLEDRDSTKVEPIMQTTKMGNGPLHCPEPGCSKSFGNVTQRNCHARQHKVAGVRRSAPAANRNFG